MGIEILRRRCLLLRTPGQGYPEQGIQVQDRQAEHLKTQHHPIQAEAMKKRSQGKALAEFKGRFGLSGTFKP